MATSTPWRWGAKTSDSALASRGGGTSSSMGMRRWRGLGYLILRSRRSRYSSESRLDSRKGSFRRGSLMDVPWLVAICDILKVPRTRRRCPSRAPRRPPGPLSRVRRRPQSLHNRRRHRHLRHCGVPGRVCAKDTSPPVVCAGCLAPAPYSMERSISKSSASGTLPMSMTGVRSMRPVTIVQGPTV